MKKLDWADREAQRLMRFNVKHRSETNCPGDCLEVRIAAALRRARKLKEAERKAAEKRGIIWAYNHYEQAELLVSGQLSWRQRR